MKPLILHGHSRPLTSVKFNRDGDLLFTSCKGGMVNCYQYSTGRHLKSYGDPKELVAVWEVAPSMDSRFLVIALGDFTVRVYDVMSGEELCRHSLTGVARNLIWGRNPRSGLLAVSAKKWADKPGRIVVLKWEVATQRLQEVWSADLGLDLEVTKLAWVAKDTRLALGDVTGNIILLDARNGEVIMQKKLHDGRITDLDVNESTGIVLATSSDRKATLFTSNDCSVISEFTSPTPLNAGVISPFLDNPKIHIPHVLLGGGQPASEVTMTHQSQGQFDTRIFDVITCDEVATIKGHFGPINTMAIHPSGNGFATGGEEGYVRIQKFDVSYYQTFCEYLQTA